MTRIQIGLTGRYQGRGFWRRVFGSGPVRITPIDAQVAEKDKETVTAVAETLNAILATQPPSRHRIGSLLDVTDVRGFVKIKTE